MRFGGGDVVTRTMFTAGGTPCRRLTSSKARFQMAFQIKRKRPGRADLFTQDKYADAVHVAAALIRERVPKARTSLTNLKTGETLSEQEIEEAALSLAPVKKRAAAA